jgi:hypothetical protein
MIKNEQHVDKAGPGLKHLFTAHPQAVGETYVEHGATAIRFGLTMIAGGIACLVHAVVPALYANSASERVKRLYSQMRARQPGLSSKRAAFDDPSWRPEYEI